MPRSASALLTFGFRSVPARDFGSGPGTCFQHFRDHSAAGGSDDRYSIGAALRCPGTGRQAPGGPGIAGEKLACRV